MSKIIFIEGPDNTGKSTQIRRIYNVLSRTSPTHIVHYAGFSGVSAEESEMMSKRMYRDMFRMIDWATRANTNLIFDRSHIGEMVYAPIFRKYSGDFVLEIEKEFSNSSWWSNLCLITFVDEPENLIGRDDGLSFSTDREIKQEEVDGFARAHNLSSIEKKWFMNITGNSADDVWASITPILSSWYKE